MKVTLLFVFLLSFSILRAQNQGNSFGWAIVLEGTKFKTLMPEGSSFYIAQNQNRKIEISDFNKFYIVIGEPILVIDNYKGGVLAFDPQGRMIFIENKATLYPVTEYEYLTTGTVKEDISMLDGTVYQKGRYMLIVQQSFDKNTYTVVIGKDKKVEMPM